MPTRYTKETRALAERLTAVLTAGGIRVTRSERAGAVGPPRVLSAWEQEQRQRGHGTAESPEQVCLPLGQSQSAGAVLAARGVWIQCADEKMPERLRELLRGAGYVVGDVVPEGPYGKRRWLLFVTTPELQARAPELQEREQLAARRSAVEPSLKGALGALAGATSDAERAELAPRVVRAHTLTLPGLGVLLQHGDREIRLLAVRAVPILRSHLAAASGTDWRGPLVAAAARPPREVIAALRPLLQGRRDSPETPSLTRLALEQQSVATADLRLRRLLDHTLGTALGPAPEQAETYEAALPRLVRAILAYSPPGLQATALVARHGSMVTAVSRMLREASGLGADEAFASALDAALEQARTQGAPVSLGAAVSATLGDGYRTAMLGALAVSARLLLAHDSSRPMAETLFLVPAEMRTRAARHP